MTNSFQAHVEYVKQDQKPARKPAKARGASTRNNSSKPARTSSKPRNGKQSDKQSKSRPARSARGETTRKQPTLAAKPQLNFTPKFNRVNPFTRDPLLQAIAYIEPAATRVEASNDKSTPIIPLEQFQIEEGTEYWDNPRFLACLCLKSVLEDKRSLNFNAIAPYAGINKGFISELVYGVLRFLPQINFIVNKLQNQKIERSHYFAVFALQLAIYQLLYMQRAEHAVLYETVNLVKQMYNKGLANMVNGILRNFLRNEQELVEQSYKQKLLPGWLDKQLVARYSEQEYAQIILHATEHPPLWIRINLHAVNQADFTVALQEQGIEFQAHEFLPGALLLPQAPAIERIPGFAQGWFVVQDLHAQYAAYILASTIETTEEGYQLSGTWNEVSTNAEGKAQTAYHNQAQATILDACCAPGGKTTHLCSLFPHSLVLACEYEPARIPLVYRNLYRCNQAAYVVNGNARHLNRWLAPALASIAGELGVPTLEHIQHYWEQDTQGAQAYLEQHQAHFQANQELARELQSKAEQDKPVFDLILLDVPCSATGVIRRHQDIKWLRRADDIEPLAQTQLEILQQAWQQLKIGGKLLYTTCSILGQENDEVVNKFIQTTSNLAVVNLDPLRKQLQNLQVVAQSVTTGLQLLPHALQGDGFYYCLLTKTA